MLKSSPKELWTYVSDTNRFNKDVKLSPLEILSSVSSLANGRKLLKIRRKDIEMKYEEEPFEWFYPYKFGVIRRFFSGPIAEIRILVDLIPKENGTLLKYQTSSHARNFLGDIIIPYQVGVNSKKEFSRVFLGYDKIIQIGKSIHIIEPKNRLSKIENKRLDSLIYQLKKLIQNYDEIIEKMSDLIRTGDELSLSRMRPFSLSQIWGFPKLNVLKVFLYATRIGILDLKWDVLCPLCRGAKHTSDSLKELENNIHCDTCNIDFTADFSQLVEITFRPNKLICNINYYPFCVGGPQVTPHIVAQQLLKPSEEKIIKPSLEEGRYRLRYNNLNNGQLIICSNLNGEEKIICNLNIKISTGNEPVIKSEPEIIIKNNTDIEQLFIFERIAWSDNAATAAQVTSLQVFRDLFAKEALRTGEQISVGSLTLVFTDLKNSTQFYRQTGDAAAFGQVMNHFDVLKKAVAEQDGAIVKTIGDAIMAVFTKPLSGIKAMLNAKKIMKDPVYGLQNLKLKAGIHYGVCIAVNLNDRLDYFGSTVNIAARLEGLSNGDDIIISSAVYNEPEVKEFFINENKISINSFDTELKGFENEQFDLWKIVEND